MQGGYRYLGYILLVFPLIIVVGFWIPYFSQIPKFDSSITAAVHIHALLLLAWVGLVVSSIGMLGKEYQEHLASGMNAAAARSAEYLSTIQVTLFAALYYLAIVRIQKRDIAEHMRYMICIALVLLPAGLARTLGYWFGVNQAASQTGCLALIDLCLICLIIFDRRRQFPARPYVVALATYLIVETGWLALGRPV